MDSVLEDLQRLNEEHMTSSAVVERREVVRIPGGAYQPGPWEQDGEPVNCRLSPYSGHIYETDAAGTVVNTQRYMLTLPKGVVLGLENVLVKVNGLVLRPFADLSPFSHSVSSRYICTEYRGAT